MEYGAADELRDRWQELLIVMRVYLKTAHHRGLEGPDQRPGARRQLPRHQRRPAPGAQLLLDPEQPGLPAATEFPGRDHPAIRGRPDELGAIGRRTTESQVHRELASGLSCPVGFKNGTDGNLKIAIDAIRAASQPHHFLSVTKAGHSAIVDRRQPGLPSSCAAAKSRTTTAVTWAGRNWPPWRRPKVMVDFSHANSRKDYKRQMGRRGRGQPAAAGDRIIGVMVESHPGGRPPGPRRAVSRCTAKASPTPASAGPTPKPCFTTLADGVKARRAKLGQPEDASADE